ncbi:MAG: hypothetical protein M3O15_10520 [Acidobacteriota bacterium]|nr:hypothetical protein [Acidobacteriota bacterium]
MAGRYTTVHAERAVVAFLEKRGARSSRGGGNFNRSRMLKQAILMLESVFQKSDPRAKMSEELLKAAFQVLDAPWDMRTFDLEHLEVFVRTRPEFGSLRPKVREDLVRAVGTLTFAERAALLDLALQHHGPDAAQREAEEMGSVEVE